VANRIKELGGLSVSSGSGSPVEGIRSGNPLQSGTTGSSATPTTADSVEITPYARVLTDLSQALQNSPDIDAARVTHFQQAIDAGQYQVDPDQTATRLLRLEQDLGETQSE
jgi:negative regulator of flagellin synthesis FlgM